MFQEQNRPLKNRTDIGFPPQKIGNFLIFSHFDNIGEMQHKHLQHFRNKHWEITLKVRKQIITVRIR